MRTQPQDLPGEPGTTPSSATRGRTRRVLASAAAGALLLGGGAAIGIAVTGGASAATGSQTASTTAAGPQHRCAQLVRTLRGSRHPVAARRLGALCTHPLLRLAVVGGIHGEVTFDGKKGARTGVFERGTVSSVTAGQLTVAAKDGTSWTWDLATGTKIRSAGSAVSASKLAQGEQVLVLGTLSGSTRDALLVRIRPAGQ